MMKLKYSAIFLFFLCLSPCLLVAQIAVVTGNDTVRYSDADDYYSKTGSDMKSGYWIYYSDSNLKKSEGAFVQGKKDGIWKKYFASGSIKNEITYKNGEPNGYAKMYYENGNLSEEGTWIDKKWVGDYKFYHENGNLSYDWKYDTTGKRTGVQKYFHENGNLMIEGEWVSGKEKGVIKEYYENGSLKAEKSFNEGKVDVESVKTYERKVVKVPEQKTMERFDGNGYYKSYNADKQIEYEGVYKGGRFMDGKRYIYDSTGTVVKTLIYRNGVKVGTE